MLGALLAVASDYGLPAHRALDRITLWGAWAPALVDALGENGAAHALAKSTRHGHLDLQRGLDEAALEHRLTRRIEANRAVELGDALGRDVRPEILRRWDAVSIATCRLIPRHARRDALFERWGPEATLRQLREAKGADFARRCLAGLLDLPLHYPDDALDVCIALAMTADAPGSLWPLVAPAQAAMPDAWLGLLRGHGFTPTAACLALRDQGLDGAGVVHAMLNAGYALFEVLLGFQTNAVGPERAMAAVRAAGIEDAQLRAAAKRAGRLEPEIREILRSLERL